MRKVVGAWAEKNKVDVQLDFLTAIGNKIDMTMGAEAVAKTGHDIFAFDIWTVPNSPSADAGRRRDGLADRTSTADRAGKRVSGEVNGHWIAVPTYSWHRAADALRAHQHVEAICRDRRAGVVSGT